MARCLSCDLELASHTTYSANTRSASSRALTPALVVGTKSAAMRIILDARRMVPVYAASSLCAARRMREVFVRCVPAGHVGLRLNYVDTPIPILCTYLVSAMQHLLYMCMCRSAQT